MSRTQIRVLLILMSTFGMGLIVSAQDRNSIQQLGELTASDGTAYSSLGFSVAVAGNTVAAGGDFTNIGAVYVYLKPLSGWGNATQVAKLTASDSFSLGYSIAISSDETTIVAGDPNSLNRGAVYVFVKPASGWNDMTETAKLTASDGRDFDKLGTAVAISGNTVVAGAPANPDVGVHGKAYVFVKPSSGWANRTQNAKFTASDGKNNDFFGNSVSIGGNTVVVGAPQRQPAIGPGAAYVFVKPVEGWKNAHETAELTASDGVVNDGLGTSVSISGDTIAAGAPTARSAHGVVYVFVRPAKGWIDSTQTAELTSAQADTVILGESVSVNGNTIVAGAALDPQTGLAFMFVKPVSGWTNSTETRKLKATNGQRYDLFGFSVSATRNTIVIGAPGVAPDGQRLEGAAYVFGK
jgi:hypothetical protein